MLRYLFRDVQVLRRLLRPERLPKSVRNAYHPDEALENSVNQAIWEEWNNSPHTHGQLPLF